MSDFINLGDIFKVSSGGTPSRKINEYFNGDIPWVKTGDLKGTYVKTPEEYISQSGLDNSSAKLFPNKTVLLAMYGATIGACSILPFEAATNQACAAILPNEKYNEKYLYYYLKSIKSHLVQQGVGGAQPNISASLIKKIKIPNTPLNEQVKIVKILEAADSIRNKDNQLTKHYEYLSQALFLEMFGDPVANSKNWEMTNLKNISLKIHSGTTPKGGNKVYVDSGITFLRSQNVWKNDIRLDDVVFIDQCTHENMAKSSLKHNDILMTKTGRFNTENSSLGRAAIFKGKDHSANINGHVYLIRLKEGVLHNFILFILTSIQYRDYIRSVCVGGIDKRQINKEHLENFPIITPDIGLQKEFVEKLKNINKQKAISQQALKKSDTLFNSLLQSAFTG